MMYNSRLAKIRQQRNLTQTDLAYQLKISRSTYASHETGRRQISNDLLCQLADFYNVSTDYLLGRQDAMPSFLSERERGVIERYRALGEHAREAVDNVLEFEYARVPKAGTGKKAVG